VSVSNYFDVIIVGAGPAGSSCATILAHHGVRVLLVEKAKFPREKICGDCINPKSWKFFDLLGVADVLRGRRLNVIDSVRVTNSSGTAIIGRLSFRQERPFFSISRSELDMLLFQRARQAGAEALEGVHVTDIRWDGHWDVETQAVDGRPASNFTARYLVGADGRNSFVARKLAEMERAPVVSQRRKLTGARRVGVQWRTHYQPQIGRSVEMYLFKTGYGGIVNVDDERATVAMVTTPQQARVAQIDLHRFVQSTLFANAAARTRFDILRPVGAVSTASPIKPTAHHHEHHAAFLAGDAHQTVEPFTGEGVFFALQDGVSTARRLLALIQCRSSVRLHDRHSRFWINRVVSPILQRSNVSDRLVAIGRQLPMLASLAAKPIMARISFSQ
jgi:geranylgeranyl reductase family protein